MDLAPDCNLTLMSAPASRRMIADRAELETEDGLRCAARHLAVAAAQLPRVGGSSRIDGRRLAAAEALLRSRAGADGIEPRNLPDGPVVRLRDGSSISLVTLFAGAHRREHHGYPCRSIDPELVHEAKELLCGLAWSLPGEGIVADSA